MKIFYTIYSMLFNKCSRCHQGDVFTHKNPYDLKNMFSMHKSCEHCNLVYQREPGFFYGAMYVSYALSSGWFTIWYVFQNLFLNLDTLGFVIGFCASIVVMIPLSIRWSRLIWLNFFYSYKKELAQKTESKRALTQIPSKP
ncbi:MAG: DUF983 domain-containing protein [Sphingobacteriaceae bacterium]|nr:DUF983 domain-containing protein [Sphingobacteriaceae bacterium]